MAETGDVRSASVCLSISAQSWKSSHSPRTRLTDGRVARSSIASRARQIKDHECDPFLAVDLLHDAHSSYQPIRRDLQSFFQEDKLSLFSPRPPSSHTVLEDKLSMFSPRPPSSHTVRRDEKLASYFCRGSNVNLMNITRSASCISLARMVSLPNLRVKMPFKHATNRGVLSATFVVPGQALIENTNLAIDVMNRIFFEQKPAPTGHRRGRLLKARLKCLEPVALTGPTIQQCRGIIAETRSYSACSSRTLQRVRDILSGAVTPKDMVESHKGPAYTSESVHRTSEASSPDPTVGIVYNPDVELKY